MRKRAPATRSLASRRHPSYSPLNLSLSRTVFFFTLDCTLPLSSSPANIWWNEKNIQRTRPFNYYKILNRFSPFFRHLLNYYYYYYYYHWRGSKRKITVKTIVQRTRAGTIFILLRFELVILIEFGWKVAIDFGTKVDRRFAPLHMHGQSSVEWTNELCFVLNNFHPSRYQHATFVNRAVYTYAKPAPRRQPRNCVRKLRIDSVGSHRTNRNVGVAAPRYANVSRPTCLYSRESPYGSYIVSRRVVSRSLSRYLAASSDVTVVQVYARVNGSLNQWEMVRKRSWKGPR